MTKIIRLENKVNTVNTTNAVASALRPILLDAFRPLVGKQVLKNDHGLTVKAKAAADAAIAKAIPSDRIGGVSLMVYPQCYGGCSIGFVVKGCGTRRTSAKADHSDAVCYYETHVNVGAVRAGVLVELDDRPDNRRSDYTAAEVAEKRAAHEAAERAFREARAALEMFGEHD